MRPLTIADRDAARQELARRYLLDFTLYTMPSYEAAAHHKRIGDALEAVERGDLNRLMLFLPPRSGKSELASKRFPAWCLGRQPRRQVIAASYNSDLATHFGRQVRNIVGSPEFAECFPAVSLAQDSKAANRMNTNQGGAYLAAGVGTAMTGFGADIAIIDDPVKDRAEADSETFRNATWDWYRSTLFTRLMPKASVIVCQCMTGDTPVLMADGSERPLSDIRAGDRIATYDDGVLGQSTVRAWKPQGVDDILAMKMTSGITVRGNKRHPFLVARDGGVQWIRLSDLKTGDKVIRAIGGNGRGWPAGTKAVLSQQNVVGTVLATICRFARRLATSPRQLARRIGAMPTSSIDMASRWQNTMLCSQSKAVSARFADSRPVRTFVPTGAASYVSTIATIVRKCAAFCATTVILRSVTQRQRECCTKPLNTYRFTSDTIVSIIPSGEAEVFDIEVERTANFIANGLVSHNTRWHEDDLSGRLLEQNAAEWHVIDMPAINDAGEALWPEWYPLDVIEGIRSTIGPREFSALYMQRPQPDEGSYFQRDWLKEWDQRPAHLNIYASSDYAVTEDGGDYTVFCIWGVDSAGVLYRLAVWKAQATPDKWIEQQCQMIRHWKPLAWFGESGVIQKAIEPMLRRRMIETQAHCRLEWVPSISDKPTRARAFQARAAMGKVRFEPGADLSEFLKFPAGKHDDEVDCASMMGRVLDELHPAIVPVETIDPNPLPGDYRPRRANVGGSVWA